jgi:lysophospholipase L1-like esterase
LSETPFSFPGPRANLFGVFRDAAIGTSPGFHFSSAIRLVSQEFRKRFVERYWFDAEAHAGHTHTGGISRRALIRALPLVAGVLFRSPQALAGTQDRTSRIAQPAEPMQKTQSSQPIVLLGASYAANWRLPDVAGRTVLNKGVPGQESWEMLERFDRDVTAQRPSAVILWGYINDVFRSPREQIDAALARARDSFDQMIGKARSAGVEVILATEVTIRPKDEWSETFASWIGWALGKQSYQDYINGRVVELNSWLRERAVRDHLLLLDLQAVLADATGQRRKGFATDDGSHITPDAYAALTAYSLPLLERHCRDASVAAPP